MAFITTTANSISSGGTISGDITIEGDLTVNGDGAGAYDEIVDGNLRVSSTNKLEFGDTGTYIHQSADGVLDLVSDTELELNATTIDINGAVEISGNTGIGNTPEVNFHIKLADTANARIEDTSSDGIAKLDFKNDARQATIGVYGDDSDNFKIDHGGGAVLTINTAQQVGIGTTSPDQTLHVYRGSAGTIDAVSSSGIVLEDDTSVFMQFLSPNNADAGLVFGDPDDNDIGGIFYEHANNKLAFRTSTTTSLVVDANGNVGIGVTDPDSTLEIKSAGDNSQQILRIRNNSDTQMVEIATDGSGVPHIGIGNSSGSTKVKLSSGGSFISTGDVGIGTDQPSTLLEIQGGLTTTGAVLTLSTKETTVVANDVLGRIDFKAPLEASGTDAILTGASIHAVATDTFASDNNKTDLIISTGASEAATVKVRIDSAGNIGMNITPSSWHASRRGIQLGKGGSGIGGGYTPYSNVALTQNAYLDTSGTWRRVVSDHCGTITSYDGTWFFHVGPSGSADGTAGFLTPMTINNDAKIQINQDSNLTALEIDAENTDAVGVDMVFGAMTSGYGVRIRSGSADAALTTGTLLDVYSKDSDNSSRNLMRIVSDDGGATGTNCLKIHNDAASTDLFLDHNGGDGASIYIDSESVSDSIIYFADPALTTGYAIRMANMDSLTTGSAILIESDSNSTSSRNLVKIVNDHADADDAVCLYLHQDGADYAIEANSGAKLTSAGVWTDASDVLRKKDIIDLPYGLDEVLKLQPRKYKYKHKDIDGIGFVAQELEKIIPEVVSGSDAIFEDVLKKEAVEAVEAVEYVAPTYWEEGDDLPDGVRVSDIKTAEVEAVEAVEAQDAVIEKDVITGGKSVAYGELVSVLVKAIQELEARVKVLES